MEESIIKDISILEIPFTYGISYGARQEWYSTMWKRRAGCGPTTAANIIMYNAKTRTNEASLFKGEIDYKGSIDMMEQIWEYVTPTRMGVNKVSILVEGVEKYAKDNNVSLVSKVLDVPISKGARVSDEELKNYLFDCIDNNRPIAFLNLHSGCEHKLFAWHWTLIVGIKVVDDKIMATIYDEGKVKEVDLGLWHRTSLIGGGFAAFE